MIRIELQFDQVEAIREHGRRAYPHECCGFLLGRDGDGARRTISVAEASNVREADQLHNRFAISPESFLSADKAARAGGLDIVGFYHSHPNAPARPSPYDVEQAWPVYSYVIVSVMNGEPADLASWVLDEDRSNFNPQEILISRTPVSKEQDECR